MFQQLKTLPELSALVDQKLPTGFGKDSLVQLSDRLSGATYAMYRVEGEGNTRLAFIRQGGGLARVEVHLSGEKTGGKIGDIVMSADEAKNELIRWLREWDQIQNPNVRLPDSLTSRISLEEKLLIRADLGSSPIGSMEEAYPILHELLEPSIARSIRRNADPDRPGPVDRNYVLREQSDGVIKLGLEFVYGRDGGHLGQDAVYVSPQHKVTHDPRPGDPLTADDKVLAKLNELLLAWMAKK